MTDTALLDRESFLGGSDAAAVLGLSPFRTRADVWLEKTRRVPRSFASSGPQEWGKILEEPVAQHWAAVTGRRVRRTSHDYRHPKYPFLRAHLDRLVEGETDAFLEVKTSGAYVASEWGESGTDDIPLHYRTQLAVYQELTGRPIAEVAVLVGGNDFRHYTVRRDDDVVRNVIDALVEFWTRYVEGGECPPPFSSEEANALFPAEHAGTLELDSQRGAGLDLVRHHLAIGELEQQINALEQQRDAEIAAVKTRLEGYTAAHVDGVEIFQWKLESRSGFDLDGFRREHPHLYRQYRKHTDSRVFRAKNAAKARAMLPTSPAAEDEKPAKRGRGRPKKQQPAAGGDA